MRPANARNYSLSLLVFLTLGCSNAPPTAPVVKDLHNAAAGFPDQISTLLKSGIPIDKLNSQGNTPLWIGVMSSNKDSVKLLLEAGADTEIRGQRGWTPLHLCAFINRDRDAIAIANLLLQNGANPNAIAPEYGKTALHYAVELQSRTFVELLIGAGAEVDQLSSNGSTPLQIAVSRGKAEMVDILLGSGANPDLRNDFGFRPIDQLNSCPNPAEIQVVFRKYGADDQMRHELFAKWREESESKHQ